MSSNVDSIKFWARFEGAATNMDGLLVIVSKATLKKQKYEGMREKKI